MARAHRKTPTKFPSRVARTRKQELGRTDVEATPLHVRTLGALVDGPTRHWIQDRATRRLGKYAPHIERLSFRFDDVNGPRGGKDIVCKGKVVLSGMPSSVVEKRAASAREAFDMVSRQLERGLGKSVSQLGGRTAVRKAARVTATRVTPTRVTAAKVPKRRAQTKTKTVEIAKGSLIGRRVGRSRERLLDAASRPEKLRGDAIVDTSLPNVSATDRKVGRQATAKRNTRLDTRRATATLEDSATGQPSRKSTRKSSQRSLSGTQLGKQTRRTLQTPKRRATRARRS
jgi:hypothetical protein